LPALLVLRHVVWKIYLGSNSIFLFPWYVTLHRMAEKTSTKNWVVDWGYSWGLGEAIIAVEP